MYKLDKALYGLKQTLKSWFEWLTSVLHSFGFKSSKSDPSLFIHVHQGSTTYILVYVDDILITGYSLSFISNLKQKLHLKFALKDLGPLHYFIRVDVCKNNDGSLHLSQQKYIQDLLKKTMMDLAKGINTPMVTSPKLSKEGSDVFQNLSFMDLAKGINILMVISPKLSKEGCDVFLDPQLYQ